MFRFPVDTLRGRCCVCLKTLKETPSSKVTGAEAVRCVGCGVRMLMCLCASYLRPALGPGEQLRGGLQGDEDREEEPEFLLHQTQPAVQQEVGHVSFFRHSATNMFSINYKC